MPAFDINEYRARISKVKKLMCARGIDVYIGSHPANMNYLSGYDGWSFYVHQCVVLTLDSDVPIWFGREMDIAGAASTVWMPSTNLRCYSDRFVDSNVIHPMEVLAQILREIGWETGRIGVEMDAWYYTAKSHEVLSAELPKATLIDIWPMVNQVRLIKSHAEMLFIRGAAQIVSKAMQVAVESIKPGVRENDAVAEITHAQISGVGNYWGDYPATLAAVPSGARSAAPHLTWTGDPFAIGSMTNIELGGCHHRYHAALARTLFLGKPHSKLVDLARVTEDGFYQALAVATAGNTCEAVESAWATSISKGGYVKHSRIGYSIGLNYPPDWGEQSASLRDGDTTILQENMCFHLILGMWMDDWGYELSETIRITDNTPEILTDFPRILVVKQ